MKIRIEQAHGRSMTIPIPNFLLTNAFLLKIGLKISKHYSGDSIPNIPPEAIDALCHALKDVKRKYGSWELVRVESCDGDFVSISL